MPDLPHAEACDFEGKLERASLNKIEGWAWDKNQDAAVFVSIFIDGQLVCTTVADQFRDDLKNLEKRGGHCAFSVNIPKKYEDGRKHHVRAIILHSEPQFVLGDLASDNVVSGQATATNTNSFYHKTTAPHKNKTAKAMLGKNNWLFLADDTNRVRDQIAGNFPVTAEMQTDARAVFEERLT